MPWVYGAAALYVAFVIGMVVGEARATRREQKRNRYQSPQFPSLHPLHGETIIWLEGENDAKPPTLH